MPISSRKYRVAKYRDYYGRWHTKVLPNRPPYSSLPVIYDVFDRPGELHDELGFSEREFVRRVER